MRNGRCGNSSDQRAFTLVELLVALAIGALLVAALLGYLRSTRLSAVTLESNADDALALQLAAELLREELRLAGARPWPPGTVPGVDDPTTWLSAPLRVEPVGAGHRLFLRYLDHRLSGPLLARDLAYEVGVDGAGVSQLYRRTVGSPRQPLVAGVSSMKLVAIVDAGGTWQAWGSQILAGRKLAALLLELSSGQLTRQLVIELPNLPELAP